MKVITVASDPNHPGCLQLQRSLKHHKYPYEILVHPFEFGGQMKWVYEWAKANWGWFLYTDAYDTFALSDEAELAVVLPIYGEDCKMLISAEKNCYPHAEKAVRYPACETEWKYVNGGGFLTTCEYFWKLYEETHKADDNDQDWLTEVFLSGKAQLDIRCLVFQTIAFEGPADFSRAIQKVPDGVWPDRIRLINNFTNSSPIFVHGNAQTRMEKIWKML